MQDFLADDGTKLAYRDDGKGVPVVALAGLPRDGRDFDYLARHIAGRARLIRLVSRGRGASQWTDAASYSVPREAADVLLLLDHLRIDKAAIIGSSRGGLIGLFIAAAAKHRLLALCLNDVGPVLERDGLARIATYVGVELAMATLDEIVDRLPNASRGLLPIPATA